MSLVFLFFMYIQLFTGIVLYFFLKPDNQPAGISLDQAVKNSSLRFWAIEHVALMLFAFALTQVGRIYIIRFNSNRDKFRSTTIYYGVSFLLVMVSAGIAMLKK